MLHSMFAFHGLVAILAQGLASIQGGLGEGHN